MLKTAETRRRRRRPRSSVKNECDDNSHSPNFLSHLIRCSADTREIIHDLLHWDVTHSVRDSSDGVDWAMKMLCKLGIRCIRFARACTQNCWILATFAVTHFSRVVFFFANVTRIPIFYLILNLTNLYLKVFVHLILSIVDRLTSFLLQKRRKSSAKLLLSFDIEFHYRPHLHKKSISREI